jgi:predicted Zn-dependent peptidase
MVVALVAVQAGMGQQPLDRTKRPGPSGVPEVGLPVIQKARLGNGLSVWLVEHHELPIIAFNLVVQAGSDRDPLDKPGVASMTAEVLDEGTASQDALQIAERLEYVGATMSVNSTFDGTFISLRTVTKHLDEAFDVFAEVVTGAVFPQKEFDRLKQQRLTSLLQQKDRASTIASLAFNRILYGLGHPYGNDPSGTDRSIAALKREDLVSFYEACYRPDNSTLIIVGDTRLKEMTALLEKKLARWKPAPVPPHKFPQTPAMAQRRVYLIDKPEAPQSEIRIGYPALARNTEHFFPVLVMNRILGGQFTSRLNLNLREKHGFTYGARSSFSFSKQPGPFTAGAGVTAAKTDSSIQEFLREIGRMHREGVTDEELQFAKKGLSGSFALTFETPAQIAGQLQNIVLYDLPEDHLATYLQDIDRVTGADIQNAAARYLDPARMAVVVVGDLKTVREGVEKLGLGETVLCDVEGNRTTR